MLLAILRQCQDEPTPKRQKGRSAGIGSPMRLQYVLYKSDMAHGCVWRSGVYQALVVLIRNTWTCREGSMTLIFCFSNC